MGKMTSALKPVADLYNALAPDNHYNFRRQVRSFIKWYGYISQVCRMFDADMQKEYVFCAYLAKLLPGEPKHELDLEGALKLEFYKLEETFKGEISLTDDIGEIVPAKGKGATGQEKKEPLEEVIQRINELFDGKFDERDRVILYSLHERLYHDEKLRRVAQTSNPQVFHQSIWPKSFGDAAQTGFVEYNEAFSSLFQNRSKYNAIMAALGDMLYREFNRSTI